MEFDGKDDWIELLPRDKSIQDAMAKSSISYSPKNTKYALINAREELWWCDLSLIVKTGKTDRSYWYCNMQLNIEKSDHKNTHFLMTSPSSIRIEEFIKDVGQDMDDKKATKLFLSELEDVIRACAFQGLYRQSDGEGGSDWKFGRREKCKIFYRPTQPRGIGHEDLGWKHLKFPDDQNIGNSED